jgi:ABC transport permease subunit
VKGLRVTAGSGIGPRAVHRGIDDPSTVAEHADAMGLWGPGGTIGEEQQEFRVVVDGVELTRGGIAVFDQLSCGFPRGRISVVLGGSGAGKSTLLRMIGGLQKPDSGSVRVAGHDITGFSERALFKVRERIGMLFQGGALLDSMTVAENVGLPLREHTRLAEPDIDEEVRRRLHAVGLEKKGGLYPAQLSGGMVRRAAMARAIVMDPEILLVDEPFSGLDPINVRRIESLLVQLNRQLGLTVIMTSHHLSSSLRMADRLVFLVDGQALSGPPADLMARNDPRVVRFLSAATDEHFEQSEPLRAVPTNTEPDPKRENSILEPIEILGARTLRMIEHFGRIARFAPCILGALIRHPYRFGRLIDDIYDAGVKSLPVICLSGMVVGLTLSLLGYTTLVRFGAEEALGGLVGLAMVRELGPVLTALLVTGRAGSAVAAEIASMVKDEQLDGLSMMSIDPVDIVVSPKALSLALVMPLLSGLFIVFAVFGGYTIAVGMLGVDPGSFMTSMEGAIDFRQDVLVSLLKASTFGALTGLIATYRGSISERSAAGVSAATTDTVVIASVMILIFDFFISGLWGI